MKEILFGTTLAILLSRYACAIEIGPGDIVTPQFDNNGTVIVVDPSTGNREILSLYPAIGTGPRESRPMSIAMLPDGDFLVTEAFVVHGLYLIDQQTGNRTFLSGTSPNNDGYPAPLGSGPIDQPSTVLYTPGGDTILVNQAGASFSTGFVTRVDLATGNRTLISGLGTGSGTDFDSPSGGALDAAGRLIVGDYDLSAVFRVDLTTGARTVISGLGSGNGPALSHILDLVVLPDGQIIAEGRHYEQQVNELFRIDPITGDRTIISTRPSSGEYERIAIGFDGNLLAAVPGADAIYSVNPVNGTETLVSGDGLGTGPGLFWGDMVVVPEPNVLTLALVGTTFILLKNARRRLKSA